MGWVWPDRPRLLDLGPLLEGGAALVDLADLGALGGDASDLWLGLPDSDFGDLVGGVADFVGSGTDLAPGRLRRLRFGRLRRLRLTPSWATRPAR
jgi:hypothetical protein